MSQTPESVAGDQLQSFFVRWSRLDEEDRAIKDDKKELMAEAKGMGFDPKALRAAFTIKLKREDRETAAKLDEHEAIVGLYLDALDENPTDRTSRGTRLREVDGMVGGFPVPAAPLSCGGTGGGDVAQNNARAKRGLDSVTAGETATETHSRPSNRDISAGDEPYPEAGPQAEASLAGTGTGTPAGHEGRSESYPEPNAGRDVRTVPPANRVHDHAPAPVDEGIPEFLKVANRGKPEGIGGPLH